jgi:hypothetical protein
VLSLELAVAVTIYASSTWWWGSRTGAAERTPHTQRPRGKFLVVGRDDLDDRAGLVHGQIRPGLHQAASGISGEIIANSVTPAGDDLTIRVHGHGRITKHQCGIRTEALRDDHGHSEQTPADGIDRDAAQWPSAAGGYLGPPSSVGSWLSGAVQRCRDADETFQRVTAHDLRHTAASLAISAGANPKVVQRMLGHASAAMTLDVYADLFESDVDTVAENVAKMWPRRAASQ